MKSLLLLLCAMAVPILAEAQPALNAKCAKNINLRAPPGGAGVYFDKDCSVAYVLPPIVGEVSVEAIARTAGLEQCPILQNYTRAFEARSQELVDMLKRVERTNSGTGGSPLFPAPAPRPSPQPGSPSDNAAILEEMERLMDAQVKAAEKLKLFWNMPGASMQLSYRVRHQDLVNEYQRLNPGIVFRAITLLNSKIYVSRFLGQNDTTTQFPAVLAAGIPGSGGVNTIGEVADDQGVASGDAQSGQVVLSLFGACPIYNPATRSMPSKLNARELAAFMVAKIQYVYELQAVRKYRMEYSLGMFLKRLQSSESKGGFFTTKTINKLIVEERTDDWFKMEVEAEDGRWIFDNDFAQVMKAQIVDRALKNIAMLVQGKPIDPPGLSKPGVNGATVTARELRKCPYMYCQIAAAVFDIANAVFGGTEAVSEFIRTHSTMVKETSEERKPLIFQGTVDFSTDLRRGAI